jgi:hypothetical protein
MDYDGEPAGTVGAGELGPGDGEDALGLGLRLGDALGLDRAVGLDLRGLGGSALGEDAAEPVPSSGLGEAGAGGR